MKVIKLVLLVLIIGMMACKSAKYNDLDDGLYAEPLLVCGHAVDTTLKEADILEAGLIVVGSHGHGAVFDVLIGSYSSDIIRKSKLPVLVVPIRDH